MFGALPITPHILSLPRSRLVHSFPSRRPGYHHGTQGRHLPTSVLTLTLLSSLPLVSPTLTALYLETWLKTFCPGCHKVNWLCAGELSDPGVPESDGFCCRHCGWCWDLEGCAQEPESGNFAEGLRRPI